MMPMQPDWGLGHYESTAEMLLPASAVVVERADVKAGDRVVDVGCGTGNAALLAAATGAQVTGVDPAARLLEVARERATAAGLEATFVEGVADRMPLADASADVLLSVFAVIFAPDAVAAAAEMARVTSPSGRIVLSAWLPEGAIHNCVGIFQKAIAEAIGMPQGPPSFAWHDPAALGDLLNPHGFSIEVEERALAFTGDSAVQYLDSQERDHPLAILGKTLFDARGGGEAVREQALAALEEGNQDPNAFRVTSRYVVVVARRGENA